jgi:hypothetical protein
MVTFNYSHMQECQKIHNFSSLGAIMGALQSEVIADLTLTHAYMPANERQHYKKLADFLKPDSDYRAYRKALSKCESRGCIPWHGAHFWLDLRLGLTILLPTVVHLHDIDTVIRHQKDVDEQQELPLINFEKWTHLKNQAVSALRFRDVPFAYEGFEMALKYLNKGLQDIGTGEEFSQVLQANSTKLKENEDSLRREFVTTRTLS